MKFKGDFDLADKASISAALGAYRNGTLVIDLTDTTYIDSTILGAFVMLERTRSERNLKARYVLGGSPVYRIFQMTGLDRVFSFFPTVEAATASLDVTDTQYLESIVTA